MEKTIFGGYFIMLAQTSLFNDFMNFKLIYSFQHPVKKGQLRHNTCHKGGDDVMFYKICLQCAKE